MEDDPVAALRRWQDCGGVWRVISRRAGTVVVGLFRCDGGEEIDRLCSSDPSLLRFLGTQDRSDP